MMRSAKSKGCVRWGRKGSERAKAAAAQAAAGGRGSRCRVRARARAERTENMEVMLVTLDVSRLSGWLNAVADCRVQREAHHEGDMEGQETGGRWGGSPSNVQGGPDW